MEMLHTKVGYAKELELVILQPFGLVKAINNNFTTRGNSFG